MADIEPSGTSNEVFDLVCWTPAGLAVVVTQQYDSGEVLMLAWADREALAHTLATGQATYYSRSRGERWVKGLTSGHVQTVREVRLDCDGDALLYLVDSPGPACHQGRRSCFSHLVAADGSVLTDRPIVA